MPEFSVTEEQLERLDALRADLEAVFVDGYGHVRRCDALDYLLDTHAPPAEVRVRTALDRRVRNEAGEIDYPALQAVARNTEGVKGSGIGAEEMYEAVLEAKVHETDPGDAVGLGGGPPDREGETVDGTDEGGVVADDGDPGPTADDGDTAAEGTETESREGREEAADADEVGSSPGPAPPSTSGSGSQLQAMMNLLSTHDDKWRKAESGDAPYEVDLPDGGVESARTKDDVKRILFTNY